MLLRELLLAFFLIESTFNIDVIFHCTSSCVKPRRCRIWELIGLGENMLVRGEIVYLCCADDCDILSILVSEDIEERKMFLPAPLAATLAAKLTSWSLVKLPFFRMFISCASLVGTGQNFA
jgi:hypothetical protein